MRLISLKKRNINIELFKKYFSFQMPTEMLETIYNLNDKNKNNVLVSIIKSGLNDLKMKSKRCLMMRL